MNEFGVLYFSAIPKGELMITDPIEPVYYENRKGTVKGWMVVQGHETFYDPEDFSLILFDTKQEAQDWIDLGGPQEMRRKALKK